MALAVTTMARVRASGDVRLSPEEVAALEAEAGSVPDARRLLGMHYYRSRAFADAERHARALFSENPNAENTRNLLAALGQSGRLDEALDILDGYELLIDPIDAADARCTLAALAGNLPEAVAAGRRALELKDAAQPEVALSAPITRSFDMTRPERNVIAFSLWGADESYRQGALRNAIVSRYLYPGWTPRFYIDDSIEPAFVDALIAEGAQVRKAPNLPAARYGLFWRFLVEDDPDVDLYLIRDADSVVNIRERAAVEFWLDSGSPFHVMRDHPAHCELMLAGMWGAHRGNLGPMGQRILTYVRSNGDRLNERTSDQDFLRRIVWPLIRRDALVHDDWFGFRTARPFPAGFKLVPPGHIGENDFARRSGSLGGS